MAKDLSELCNKVKALCDEAGVDFCFVTEGYSRSSTTKEGHIRDVARYHQYTEGRSQYADWLFGEYLPEYEELYTDVENALGIKLFIWQKRCIFEGSCRQYGDTLGQVLHDLLTNIDGHPLDYSKQLPRKYLYYKQEMKDVYDKLRAAGIPVRRVLFSHKDLEDWRKEHVE